MKKKVPMADKTGFEYHLSRIVFNLNNINQRNILLKIENVR
jgi:hypothetical protein